MHSRSASQKDVDVILDDLRRVVASLRRSSRAAEKRVGLSAAQLFVLHALKDGAPLSLSEIAVRTHTHQSTVSEVVQRLRRRRLVGRVTSSDGRRVELSLTAAGRKLLARAPDAAQERLIDALERLAPRKRRQLADGMQALVGAMGLASEEPLMLFDDRR
jgi:DNA-binding MarR family transcriptional regulator